MSGADLGEAFQATALSGSLLLALAVAAAAGLVAFLSPCVLPVVPGYLGYVSGLAGQGSTTGTGPGVVRTPARPSTGRMLAGSGLFVAGFTIGSLVAILLARALARRGLLYAFRADGKGRDRLIPARPAIRFWISPPTR